MDTIQAVIAEVPRQRERVQRLVKFCRELDGTEVRVVSVSDEGYEPKYPGNALACRAAHALRLTAEAMAGQPFIWLEPDSVPVRPRWSKSLSDAYRESGCKFLLSSDQNPPYDLIGGIGVYPPETAWLVPEHFDKHGWDRWLLDCVSHLVHRTPIIQHSYGLYSGACAYLHQFPRDAGMIRSETVIFHKDKLQGLMGHTEKVFAHSGDLGDVIAALPAIRSLGGGRFVGTYGDRKVRESIGGARFEALRPLLEAQPYIIEVQWNDDPQDITHDFDGFRIRQLAHEPQNGVRAPRRSLLTMQAEQMGVHEESSPWLTAPRDPRSIGIAVIARSPRYHNPLFPWQQIAYWLRDRSVFVGLPEEHQAFERVCHRAIPYIQTSNLLELASVIAGAKLFIGNQSCPFWIAAGLGVPIIQEVYPQEMNSIVSRGNAHYPLQPQAAISTVTRYI